MDELIDRKSTLTSVGYNVPLLGSQTIDFDFLSDSWLNKGTGQMAEDVKGDGPASKPLEAALSAYYPYDRLFAVFRGRYAEFILISSMELKGKTVLTNSLFPTTAYHLTCAGAQIEGIGVDPAHDIADPAPFKGNIDLDALESALKSNNVGMVYLELCVNGLGGQPLALANLKDAHTLTQKAHVPLILDGTRLLANAYMNQQRESTLAGRSLLQIAKDLCAASDGLTAGLTKDFLLPQGGLIALNDQQIALKVQEKLDLMYGRGVSPEEELIMRSVLSGEKKTVDRIVDRAKFSQKLHSLCADLQVPTTHPWGGHGLFVDAGALYPHLSDAHHPAETLASQLYLSAAVRGAPNLAGAPLDSRLRHLVRLAIPVGSNFETAENSVRRGLLHAKENQKSTKGLQLVSQPPGLAGPYLKQLKPLDPSALG